MSQAVLELQRASRWYGPVIALNDVTLSLGPGVTGLLGPNGAGKSTLLKLASGQLRPSQGQVRLFGRESWGHPELFHRVGLCPDVDAFWERLSGRELIEGLLKLSGFAAEEAKRRAGDALATVGLSGAAERKLGGYSKGMRQRARLAQAIAHDPELLLLDEPLTGMDPINRRQVIELVRRLGREGRSVVVSSHILHEVEAMTRRVLLIHNGKLLAEGDVGEIRALLDEHPHTVALKARDPRAVAAALVRADHVRSISFGPDGQWLTIQSARPDALYAALPDVAEQAGIEELFSPDEDLASVFQYLMERKR